MEYKFCVNFNIKSEAGITANLEIELTDFLRFKVVVNRELTNNELDLIKTRMATFIRNRFGLVNPEVNLEATDLTK